MSSLDKLLKVTLPTVPFFEDQVVGTFVLERSISTQIDRFGNPTNVLEKVSIELYLHLVEPKVEEGKGSDKTGEIRYKAHCKNPKTLPNWAIVGTAGDLTIGNKIERATLLAIEQSRFGAYNTNLGQMLTISHFDRAKTI